MVTTSKQDRGSVKTASDLEQKYDLASISTMKVAIENSEDGLNKTNTTLEEFMNATVKSLEDLQDQVDGNITTWFFNGIPTLENAPANEWTTQEDKINHLGDLYYDQDTGYAYRFSMVNNAYEWAKITDNDVVEALALANSAQDTADSKRRVFVSTPVPPYDSGDLWFKDSEIYICQISKDKNQIYAEKDFIIATKYTDDTYAKQIGSELKVLSGTVTTIKEGFDSFKVEITTTVDGLDEKLVTAQTSIEANTNEIKLKVDKSGVIGAINLSNEEALIQAKKINLVGAVTISALDSNLNSTITNASTNASNAVTTANTANSTANATKNTLDSLCVLEDNVTVIDGGKILTNSITSKQINVENLFAQDIVVNGSFKGATLVSSLNSDVSVTLGENEVISSGMVRQETISIEGIQISGKPFSTDVGLTIGSMEHTVVTNGPSTSIQTLHSVGIMSSDSPITIISNGDIRIINMEENSNTFANYPEISLFSTIDILQGQINNNIENLDTVKSRTIWRICAVAASTTYGTFAAAPYAKYRYDENVLEIVLIMGSWAAKATVAEGQPLCRITGLNVSIPHNSTCQVWDDSGQIYRRLTLGTDGYVKLSSNTSIPTNYWLSFDNIRFTMRRT